MTFITLRENICIWPISSAGAQSGEGLRSRDCVPLWIMVPLADDGRFESLLAAASNDLAYQALIRAVADRTRGANLGAYAKHIDNMELVDEAESDEQLVSLDGKLVIPETWVSQAIATVHAHHLGYDLTLQNAYWWPQMKLHIKNAVEGCQACARHQRLSPELPWMRPNETYFQSGPNFRHCIDLFSIKNEKIALLCDWWSGMTWVQNFG